MFDLIFTIIELHKNTRQLYMNIVFLIKVMEPSNAKINQIFTIVPSWVVIISASGDRERPKSATFIFQLFPFFVTKTFNDLRSRWIIIGFIEWRNCIPSAISRAKLNRYFQDKTTSSFFLCNKSNKLPYILKNIYWWAKLSDKIVISVRLWNSN